MWFCNLLLSQHSPHRKPVVPDTVVRADIVRIEVEVATVVGVARTERGRPIVAANPNAIEAVAVATARSRKENETGTKYLFHAL